MSDQHQDAGAVSAAAPMFSRAAWVRIVPFATYLAFIVLVDVLGRLGVPAASLRWLYAVKVSAVALTLLIFWRQYRELQRWRVSPTWVAIALASGVAVWWLWISLDAPWMVVGAPDGFDPRTNGQLDWLLVAARIAGAALVVPVMEELFWRSFLMRWIEQTNFEQVEAGLVRPWAVLASAVLFGFEHNQWLAGIVAGLVYGVLYRRNGMLWSAVVAHGVTNLTLGLWIVHTQMWTYW